MSFTDLRREWPSSTLSTGLLGLWRWGAKQYPDDSFLLCVTVSCCRQLLFHCRGLHSSYLRALGLMDHQGSLRNLALWFADVQLCLGATALLEGFPLVQGHLYSHLDHHLSVLHCTLNKKNVSLVVCLYTSRLKGEWKKYLDGWIFNSAFLGHL